MQATVISHLGKEEISEVTRTSLSRVFKVHNRDLRPIFLLKQIATIIVRENAIILNLGSIKCLIGKQEVYFLHTEDSKDFIESLLHKIIEARTETQSPPFEFIVLEFTLINRLEYLRKKYYSTERSVNNLLGKLKTNFSEENLERLLTIKKKLSTLEVRVQETQDTLVEILEDEEEMEFLNLSRKKQKKAEEEKNAEEIESMLESYLDQFEDISHKISTLTENIDDTQEIITLKMANIRNTIIRFDLLISIITAAFAVPAVLVGLYGMNIQNNLEKNHNAFQFVEVGILVFLVIIFFTSWWYLRRKKILS